MKKGVAVLEVGVGEKAERGVFRFLRDDYQAFVSDAVVLKPFSFGRYRLVSFFDDILVERIGNGNGIGSGNGNQVEIGYIGKGGESDVVVGGEVGETVERYSLGYVVLGYGYDGGRLLNRALAVSELRQAMSLLSYCEFEVKESEGVGDESRAS